MMEMGIGYRGVVTLQLKKGNKKPYKTLVVKNTGTTEFFRILCNAVMGNSMNAYMPQFLGIFNVSGGVETEVASVRVHWDVASVEQENGEYYTALSFIIPGAYLSGESMNRLKLFNTSSVTNTTSLAELDLGTSVTLSNDSNLSVVWKMYFGNQESSTDGD